MRETDKIWMNGELVDWADATVHVGTHGLHYGTGVFEGIRCYETDKGPAVFRLTDHLNRLQNSAKLLYMELPYSTDDLHAACRELIGANGLPECYLRPIAFSGYGELGVSTAGNPVEVVIMSWPWGAYLGDEGLKNGIRVKISSWQRVGPTRRRSRGRQARPGRRSRRRPRSRRRRASSQGRSRRSRCLTSSASS